MRILYLEDHSGDAELTQRKLGEAFPDCQVVHVISLGKAREVLKKDRNFDLVLLDMKLPDGNGLELFETLNKEKIACAVIVLTGSGDEESAVAALKAGANDYLTKKDNYLQTLPVSVMQAIRNYKKTAENARNKIRVLYVEHNKADIDLTIRHFKRYAPNFQFSTVFTAEDALRKLPENGEQTIPFDILLLDYRLSGINALEFVKIIRQERKLDVAIVMVTGHGNEEVAIEALRLGVDEYLVKRPNYILRLPSLLQSAFQHHELVKKQTALTESETKYRLLAENSGDVIFVLDLDLNYRFVSPSVKFLRGFDTGEAMKQNISEVLTPESLMKAQELFIKLVPVRNGILPERSEPQVIELEMYKKDGGTIWTEVKASLIMGEDGKPTGILGVTRDISLRKAARDELFRSREEYREFFEDDITGDHLSSADGHILNCNPAFLEIFGFKSKEEALNFNRRELFLNPSDRDSLVERIKKERKIKNCPLNMRRLDGKTIHVLENFVGIFDDQNKLKQIRGYIVDVTDRTIAEREQLKLSRAVGQSPVSIVITDTRGNIEYVNPKFSEVTGYSPEEALGKNPRFLKSGKVPDEVYTKLWQTISGGGEWFGELLNRKKDGSLYWEFASISPIRDRKGDIINYLAVKEDITEKKRKEEELQNAKNKAEESDRLKTAFLHNISHEIRTPLNAIVGFSALISDPSMPVEKRSFFSNIIVKSSDHLLSVITDIVNIATIEAGQERITEKELNLNSRLKMLYEQFEGKAQSQKIEFDYINGLNDQDSEIVTDETKLTQILSNLLDNAFKFTKSGKIKFGYSLKGNELEFFVQDSGIGIEEGMFEEIFKRFRQVETSNVRQYGGSGLGLSISKAYVELLGGKIWINSEPGAGSIFYFTIPFMNILNKVDKTEDFPVFGGKGWPGTKTILVAEDEDLNFFLIEELLSGPDFKIIRAFNGLEAVDFCRQFSEIDLVLMDIKMPLMNGFEATRKIMEFLPKLPVIAQTAYSSETDRNNALASGCAGFISKPFKKEVLLSLIKDHIIKKE